MVGVDVDEGGFDAPVLCSELVKTLVAMSGYDDSQVGFKVMDSESKRSPKASSGTNDENTHCVLDSWHGNGGEIERRGASKTTRAHLGVLIGTRMVLVEA